jgi:hypothetical protein
LKDSRFGFSTGDSNSNSFQNVSNQGQRPQANQFNLTHRRPVPSIKGSNNDDGDDNDNDSGGSNKGDDDNHNGDSKNDDGNNGGDNSDDNNNGIDDGEDMYGNPPDMGKCLPKLMYDGLIHLNNRN